MPKLKLFSLAIALLVCLNDGTAQNSVSLASANGKVFTVILQGNPLNKNMQAHVLLEKILEDTLQLELEFENRKKFPLTIYLLEQGLPCKNKEFNYRIAFNDVTLKCTFAAVYDMVPAPALIVPPKPAADSSNLGKRPYGNLCMLKNGALVYFNNVPKQKPCQTAMPQEYLAYAASLISKAQLEEAKSGIVEMICRNNCISIAQLGVLLEYIDYEIGKLKMVRIAYPHLVDLSDRKKLEKNFRFDASVHELNNFLDNPGESMPSNANTCTNAASEMIMNAYVEKLGTYSTDAERFEAFKKGYAGLCYSTAQAAQVLNKFIHDREKLDAAKLLYFNCVEKGSFINVAAVFSYNQTTSELRDFIDKQSR